MIREPRGDRNRTSGQQAFTRVNASVACRVPASAATAPPREHARCVEAFMRLNAYEPADPLSEHRPRERIGCNRSLAEAGVVSVRVEAR
jgi:hypothetical protein